MIHRVAELKRETKKRLAIRQIHKNATNIGLCGRSSMVERQLPKPFTVLVGRIWLGGAYTEPRKFRGFTNPYFSGMVP